MSEPAPVPDVEPLPGFSPSESRVVREVLNSMSDLQLGIVGMLLERNTTPAMVPRLRSVE